MPGRKRFLISLRSVLFLFMSGCIATARVPQHWSPATAPQPARTGGTLQRRFFRQPAPGCHPAPPGPGRQRHLPPLQRRQPGRSIGRSPTEPGANRSTRRGAEPGHSADRRRQIYCRSQPAETRVPPPHQGSPDKTRWGEPAREPQSPFPSASGVAAEASKPAASPLPPLPGIRTLPVITTVSVSASHSGRSLISAF